MDLGLSGRTALVCGASSGLGLASAEALTEEGANVVLLARRAKQLAEHAARLGGVAVAGDVNDDGDLEQAVSTAVERFGGLDVLVWNGGGPPPGTALEADEASLDSALQIYQLDPPDLGTRILPDLIEAAARSGDEKAGMSALERLSERALASGTRLASGLLARSRALLSHDNAEEKFREAIEHLRQSDADVHLARTFLLYGEWLRRKRRRRDARAQLRAARESFEHLGYAAFAHRAVVELQATGETVRKRVGDGQDQLTPQEAHITRLVVEGSSNRQVASQLFISQNTVEYHLHKVFRKVGVTSRTQLAHALLDPSRTGGTSASIACWQPQGRRDPLTPLEVR